MKKRVGKYSDLINEYNALHASSATGELKQDYGGFCHVVAAFMSKPLLWLFRRKKETARDEINAEYINPTGLKAITLVCLGATL